MPVIDPIASAVASGVVRVPDGCSPLPSSGLIEGHTVKIFRSKSFTGERAWAALDIANMNGITTRLHWTDQPYKWHVNDGQEVFAVLDGRVEMHFKEDGVEQSTILETGDVFYASVGTAHVAHPLGVARILVVESEGSV